jgi:hypothetical protein
MTLRRPVRRVDTERKHTELRFAGFLHSVHGPGILKLKRKTAFRKLDLFPSSGEVRHILSHPQQELISISG